MEPGFQSPLFDLFARGEVPREVRLMAAQGTLAPRAHEQLALLVLLVGDADPEVSGAAEATLNAIPRESLAAFIARTDVSSELRSFVQGRGIEPAATAASGDEPFIVSPDGEPEHDRLELPDLLEFSDKPEPGKAPEAAESLEPRADSEAEVEKQSTVTKLASMSVSERMGAAMKGTREERAILIRDPNKIVSVAVLSSPKVTEAEVEAFAKMGTVSEHILRIIGSTRAYLKNYSIVTALVKNSKTPAALSMNLLSRLNEKDLRQLTTNRNIPEILRMTARKYLQGNKG